MVVKLGNNIVSTVLGILPCDLSIPPWYLQLVESQTLHSGRSRCPAKQKTLSHKFLYVKELCHLHGECPPNADDYHLLVMINTDEERSLSHIHMECCKHQVCVLQL